MQTKFIPCETLEAAKDAAPWASEIVAVEGGFLAFESVEDARVWKQQQ